MLRRRTLTPIKRAVFYPSSLEAPRPCGRGSGQGKGGSARMGGPSFPGAGRRLAPCPAAALLTGRRSHRPPQTDCPMRPPHARLLALLESRRRKTAASATKRDVSISLGRRPGARGDELAHSFAVGTVPAHPHAPASTPLLPTTGPCSAPPPFSPSDLPWTACAAADAPGGGIEGDDAAGGGGGRGGGADALAAPAGGGVAAGQRVRRSG
eukprot:365960-Chlamydomonas_euryale.AAC.9